MNFYRGALKGNKTALPGLFLERHIFGILFKSVWDIENRFPRSFRFLLDPISRNLKAEKALVRVCPSALAV